MTAFRKTFFGKLIQKIIDYWNNSAEPYIESLLDPIVPEIKAMALDEFKEIAEAAYTAIKQAAQDGVKPEGWLDVAYDAIKAQLIASGKDMSSTAINLLATIFQGHAKADAVAQGTTVSALAEAEKHEAING